MVNNLLLKGSRPNAQTREATLTPLHLAASKGCALCVSALVLGGADVDSCNTLGETPLYVAAKHSRIAAVQELLAAGADLDVRENSDSWSPLERAARNGRVGIVREFLQHGSSVKACDEQGYTPLHCAAMRHDNGEIIRALLEAGAGIEAKTTEHGRTPLHYAVRRRVASSGTLHALLEGGANPNARDTRVNTPLNDACQYSCVGGVELLLRWGSDETLINQNEKTAEEMIGAWEADGEDEQHKADDQRIRHMLARAPADRSWRRRGWLVLARSFPEKVQLAQDSNRDGVTSVEEPRAGCEDPGGGGDGKRDEKADVARLVSRVVGLNAKEVFGLVVSFV